MGAIRITGDPSTVTTPRVSAVRTRGIVVDPFVPGANIVSRSPRRRAGVAAGLGLR